MESYKHQAAKDVLAGWFRTEAARVGYDEYAKACGCSWRVNRGAPLYGVHVEYPVCAANLDEWGIVHVLDEPYCVDAFSESGGPPPSYDDLIIAGLRVFSVLDVAIQHKGAILYGFEVVHQNGITERKAALLDALECVTYAIDAEWILRQCWKPDELHIRRTYGRRLQLPSGVLADIDRCPEYDLGAA